MTSRTVKEEPRELPRTVKEEPREPPRTVEESRKETSRTVEKSRKEISRTVKERLRGLPERLGFNTVLRFIPEVGVFRNVTVLYFLQA